MLTPHYALALVLIYLFAGDHHSGPHLPQDRQKMTFTDPAQAVQDSMVRLRQIVAAIEPRQFTNCFVQWQDSTLVLNRENLGKLDSLSTANAGFRGMPKGRAQHVITILRFLRRNRIAGTYHDVGTGLWRYSYQDDPHYETFTTVRSIYIWEIPADTLTPIFQYYNYILDRRHRMVLVGLKDVPYRKF